MIYRMAAEILPVQDSMHCGEVILYYKDCVSVLLIAAIGMHEV